MLDEGEHAEIRKLTANCVFLCLFTFFSRLLLCLALSTPQNQKCAVHIFFASILVFLCLYFIRYSVLEWIVWPSNIYRVIELICVTSHNMRPLNRYTIHEQKLVSVDIWLDKF